ncbi:helix-turn-helix domain-containing protein [Roseateles noduli]|uniref:helix-turn-helix domain-containing protein n=1 Tax=Roseateles noduli TaxID=2052484 RepID=UPI003D64760D
MNLARSTFASKFTEATSISPARYITRWRLSVAADLLASSKGLRVTQVAQQVGYKSEAAFSRAFKSEFGRSPRDARGSASHSTVERDGVTELLSSDTPSL